MVAGQVDSGTEYAYDIGQTGKMAVSRNTGHAPVAIDAERSDEDSISASFSFLKLPRELRDQVSPRLPRILKSLY